MTLPAFADHELIVISPGTKRVHGDDVDDWSDGATTTRTIKGCWVEPKSTEENSHRRDTVRAGYDILLPDVDTAGNTVVPPDAKDRVIHPLETGYFGVVGDVLPVRSASGGLNHWFAYVERWTARG